MENGTLSIFHFFSMYSCTPASNSRRVTESDDTLIKLEQKYYFFHLLGDYIYTLDIVVFKSMKVLQFVKFKINSG